MSRHTSCFAFSRLALAALVCLGASQQVLAQSVPLADAENTDLWFVELTGRPVADGGSLSAVQAEKSALRAAALAAGITFVERRSYDTLFNGLAIEATSSNRQRLAKLSGVRALYPVEVVNAPTPQPSDVGSVPDMALATSLSGVKAAQNNLGLSGAGVRVAIIDSGVDFDHLAFGGSGVAGTTAFPTARVVAGWDFVGDNYNAAGSTAGELIPAPDAIPRDCAASGASPITPTSSASGGHGTHVAGIVGANGAGLLGAAPQVSLGAYRVFGCYGSSSADIIMAAMERALADGMHVVNMSLGAARQWPQYPTAQAAARLAKKGVVVVAAAGNNGPGSSSPDALYASGAPGVGDGVISVASFDNAQRSFTVNGTPNGYSLGPGSISVPTSGSMLLGRTGTTAAAADACPPHEGMFGTGPWVGGAWLPAGSLEGRVALIRRGTCGFYAKSLNAQRAGAIGVVIYNNVAGAIAPSVSPPTPIAPAAAGAPLTIPVVGIQASQGAVLDALIAAGPTQLTWTTDGVGYPFGTGGLISSFSSYGLGPDLSFKPNLGAPGGGIVSTYPLGLGGTATLSGTSMASPHVAGAVALVLQAIPTAAQGRTPGIVSSAPAINMMTRLMNTAKPAALASNPASGVSDSAHRQGAGMIDVATAVQSKQFVVPGALTLGESQNGAVTRRLTLRNDAAAPVTYTLGHQNAASTGGNTGTSTWVIGGTQTLPASVSYSNATVTVPARGTAAVDVSIAPNAGTNAGSIYGGYITLTPSAGGSALSVPYAGYVGDFEAIQLLRPGANGFPWLANRTTTSWTRCTTSCSYSMVGSTGQPNFLVQLGHHARQFKLEALDAATGASRGVITDQSYLNRSSSPSTFTAWIWDGSTSMGTQPNGDYRVRISALRPLGDAGNPAHWDTWTSPVLTIARP